MCLPGGKSLCVSHRYPSGADQYVLKSKELGIKSKSNFVMMSEEMSQKRALRYDLL